MQDFNRRDALKIGAGAVAGAAVVSGAGTAQAQELKLTPEKGAKLRVLRPSKFVQGDETLWLENTKKYQQQTGVEVRVVHPGVVATNLGGDAGSTGNWFKRLVMISPEEGAQMPLICATQPGLENGGYWHNVHGRMLLPAEDPARDSVAAAALWDRCEALAG